MTKKAVAEIYHQETKYSETKMSKYVRPLDWNAQPHPYKEYHSEQKIDLIPDLPFQNNPFTGEPLAPMGESRDPMRQRISRLLYFTNGVTAHLAVGPGQTLYMRAAPTAGGLYPTEIYLATRDLPSFKDGIYNFHVRDHSLTPVWDGNFWNEFERYCMGHPAISQSNVLMILTAVYQRSAWRYQERAYRRILLDTGHVLGNITAYAPEEGWSPCPIGGFFDSELNRLLFLDETQEGVLLLVALPPTAKTNSQEIRERLAFPSSSKNAQQEAPESLQLTLHHASSILPADKVGVAKKRRERHSILASPQGIGSGHPIQEVIPLPRVSIDWSGGGIGPTILHRRSTRVYTGEAFSMEEVVGILDYAYDPIQAEPSYFFDASLIETYLVVQNVEGLQEGLYLYDSLGPDIKKLSVGSVSEQTWHFCLGQELARDAAAIIIHVAHLKTALDRYGDRAYRYLHLDAGHLGERMNLAAIHLGLGVSGIGGFYDDEVNAMLKLPLDWAILYITTLGKPASR